MVKKNKLGGAPRGEGNPKAKLTVAKVRAMRKAYASGRATQVELAEKYDITAEHVNRVIAKLFWKHVK